MDILLEKRKNSRRYAKKLELVRRNHGAFANRAAQELGVDPAIILGIMIKEVGGREFRLGESIQMLFMINRFTPKYKEKYPNRPLPS